MVLAISVRGGAIHHPHFGGIALTYLFGAFTNTTQFVQEEQLTVIVHWTFGTLNGAGEVIIILLLLALTLPCCSATHGATTPSIKGATRWRPLLMQIRQSGSSGGAGRVAAASVASPELSALSALSHHTWPS